MSPFKQTSQKLTKWTTHVFRPQKSPYPTIVVVVVVVVGWTMKCFYFVILFLFTFFSFIEAKLFNRWRQSIHLGKHPSLFFAEIMKHFLTILPQRTLFLIKPRHCLRRFLNFQIKLSKSPVFNKKLCKLGPVIWWEGIYYCKCFSLFLKKSNINRFGFKKNSQMFQAC